MSERVVGEKLVWEKVPEAGHIEKIRYLGDSRFLLHELVLEHLTVKKNNTILDIGCGLGEFLESIQNPTVLKIGIDNDPECIEICKKSVKQPNVHFRVADAHALPFPPDFFDIVTCISVLEHIDNPTAVIREAYRVCKKGGIGIFVTPNLGRPSRMFLAMRRIHKRVRSGHKQGWDYHLLRDNLQYNGWKVAEIITRLVDCPFYDSLPRTIGNFFSHRLLPQLFPRIGSELYAFCRK